MTPSRRRFLQAIGTTAGTGALVSTASPVAAHGKPATVWNPAHSSNYTSANRESDYDIRWYVIHVAEGTYEGTISVFKDPGWNASTHYVIENDSDPEITQMVDESDIAWHGGGTNYNDHALGIEHAGHVGSTFWTEATYQKSGALAQWACETYGIPMVVRRYAVAPCDQANGAGGVIGHHQIPETDCGANDHTDPGSTWNWGKFEGYLRRHHLGVGDNAVASANLNVRDSPGGTLLETAPLETSGTVVDGPVSSGGYQWYEVDYDDGVATGWSAADWLPYSRFGPGSSVSTTAALSVRDGPGTGNARLDTAYSGEGGTVIDGPVDADGYRWFKVNYNSAATGWSAGFWLN